MHEYFLSSVYSAILFMFCVASIYYCSHRCDVLSTRPYKDGQQYVSGINVHEYNVYLIDKT